MEKTLTIRIDKAQDQALTERANALGQTRSVLVRALIAKGLDEQPLGSRIGHLKGRLELATPRTELGRRIKKRNWR